MALSHSGDSTVVRTREQEPRLQGRYLGPRAPSLEAFSSTRGPKLSVDGLPSERPFASPTLIVKNHWPGRGLQLSEDRSVFRDSSFSIQELVPPEAEQPHH